MCVFKNGTFYHYEFMLDGRRHRGSTGTASKPQAIAEERRQRERLEKSYSQVVEGEAREQRRKTIQQAADEFLLDYKLKHESSTFAVYALGHVTDLLGGKLVVEITPRVVKRYQTDRLSEKAGPKTINDEVLLPPKFAQFLVAQSAVQIHHEGGVHVLAPQFRCFREHARLLVGGVGASRRWRGRELHRLLAAQLRTDQISLVATQPQQQQIDLVH